MNAEQLAELRGRWICSMIGAREHYALPRSLDRIGALARLYTDAWAGPLLRRLRFGPALLRGLAARHHQALPGDKVVAFTMRGLQRKLAARPPQTLEDQYLHFAEEGRAFALQVNEHLERNWRAIRPSGFIGYNTGCLETQQLLASHGLPSVVDQIDPARVEQEIVQAEAAKWPGWQGLAGQIPETYFRRLEDEWRLARRVIVNSEWSRDALIRQGVPDEKIVVIPLCYEAGSGKIVRPVVGSNPILTVLWMGQVILRKGIQYLIEAAKLLRASPVRFVIAGPIGISQEAVASAPENLKFIGPVTRDRIGELYRSADLFVLPTLSDGFAITQLEAMAYGLPVIATRHCAEVVADGENGRIVPAADPLSLASVVEELVSDRAALAAMSRKASETVQQFSIARTAQMLECLLQELSSGTATAVTV